MRKTKHGILLLLLALPFGYAHAASGSLYLSPSAGVFQVDQTFTVAVLANTDGAAVNAIEGELAYRPSEVEVEKISVEHSVLSSWSTSPAFDGAAGIIKFSGWAGRPYIGKDGLLATITFRSTRVGQTNVSFNSGAMLTADGKGSNIITTMTGGSYTFSPKQVTPPAEPMPTTTSEAITANAESAPLAAPIDTSAKNEDQAASVISSGIELAPILIPFFAALVLIAFGIAFVLHRQGVR